MLTSSTEISVDPEIDNRIIDTIFGALGVDDTILDEKKPGEEQPVLAIEPQQDPWILHVDDDRELSAVMGKRFEAYGIKVVRAFDGTGGFRKALKHHASAIVLDYEMPNGQGDYVLRRLKENPITRDIPVFMLTGVKDRFLERRLLSMGAARFFNKPVDFTEMINELREFIDIPD